MEAPKANIPVLAPNALIYATKSILIPWDPDPNSGLTYKAGCVIFEHKNYKYVLSVRRELISCKEINLFYCVGGTCVYKNQLHILFQSIDTRIVILGTIGCRSLQLDLSTLFCGNENEFMFRTSIPTIIIPTKFIIPKRSELYSTRNINITFDNQNIAYVNTVCDIKFRKSVLIKQSYLPENYFYLFESTTDINICGDFVWDRIGNNNNHGLGAIGSVGLIVNVENKLLTVLPMKYLHKIILLFIHEIVNENCQKLTYMENLPFTYVTRNNEIIINSVCNQSCLQNQDRILSIDNKNVSIQRARLMIFDEDYGKQIPLTFYAKYNFSKNIPIQIKIGRPNPENKSITVIESTFVLASNSNNKKIFPLTDQPDFYPTDYIPYVNLNGLIIVKLTHELLDTIVLKNIKLNSYAVDDILALHNVEYTNAYMSIACLNAKLIKKISYDKCMIIVSFNGSEIKSLTDFVRLRKKSNRLIVTCVKNISFEIII